MQVIFGARDYEKTESGDYPRYNQSQMNIFVSNDCPNYTALQIACNIYCYDWFGKYQNELTKKEKEEFDRRLKGEYGLHNVNPDHLIDWGAFDYDEEYDQFILKDSK